MRCCRRRQRCCCLRRSRRDDGLWRWRSSNVEERERLLNELLAVVLRRSLRLKLSIRLRRRWMSIGVGAVAVSAVRPKDCTCTSATCARSAATHAATPPGMAASA
jgi:hypothetical protein